MKTFFIVGNKRSGTSLLVRLLNLHPNVFCAQESGIPYLLYRFAQEGKRPTEEVLRSPGTWEHPRDDEAALVTGLWVVGDVLDRHEDPVDAFRACTRELVERGNKKQGQPSSPGKYERLSVIGDKKPVQYADPEVRAWLDETFDPVYLHSVRHPRECLRSMHSLELLQWWKRPVEEIGEWWAEHERWALEIDADRRLTYRYEDLLEDPVRIMRTAFDHLGLEPSIPASVSQEIRKRVKPQKQRAPEMEIPYTDAMREIMEIHGYEES